MLRKNPDTRKQEDAQLSNDGLTTWHQNANKKTLWYHKTERHPDTRRQADDEIPDDRWIPDYGTRRVQIPDYKKWFRYQSTDDKKHISFRFISLPSHLEQNVPVVLPAASHNVEQWDTMFFVFMKITVLLSDDYSTKHDKFMFDI